MADSNREIPTKEEIEQRAYEIYLERGQTNGRHMEDWIEAEKELYEQYFESKAKGQGATDGQLSAGRSGAPASTGSSTGSSSSGSRETESTQKPSAYAASASGSASSPSSPSSPSSASGTSSSGSAQTTPNWQAPSRTSGSSQGSSSSSSSKKEEEVPDKKGNQRAGYKE